MLFLCLYPNQEVKISMEKLLAVIYDSSQRTIINNIGIMKQVEEAEIAKFTPQEQREYEASKMAYRDIKNSIDTAKREGKEEGLAEGMEKGLAEGMEKGLAEGMEKGMSQRSLEIARTMLAKGMDAVTVMEITGLSERQLKQLKE